MSLQERVTIHFGKQEKKHMRLLRPNSKLRQIIMALFSSQKNL